jgi:hypothetical protein
VFNHCDTAACRNLGNNFLGFNKFNAMSKGSSTLAKLAAKKLLDKT